MNASRFIASNAGWHVYVPGRGWTLVDEAVPALADHGLARLELGLDDAGDLIEVSYVTTPVDVTITPGGPASSSPDDRNG